MDSREHHFTVVGRHQAGPIATVVSCAGWPAASSAEGPATVDSHHPPRSSWSLSADARQSSPARSCAQSVAILAHPSVF